MADLHKYFGLKSLACLQKSINDRKAVNALISAGAFDTCQLLIAMSSIAMLLMRQVS